MSFATVQASRRNENTRSDLCADGGGCIKVRFFCALATGDLLLREGSMPDGRDALAARFTRAWSAKCGRAPYPDSIEAAV
jgi:hypothetical protein